MMTQSPFWLDDRPKQIDLRYCAALLPDGSRCQRKAEVLPRLVGWPASIPFRRWTPENAVALVLELPICGRCRRRYSEVSAYVQPRNWRVVCDYAEMAKRPVPMRDTLQVEFVPIDYLDEQRAARAEAHH